MGKGLMQLTRCTRSGLARTLILLVIGGCGGPGSGLIGIATTGGGGGTTGGSADVLTFFGQPSSATAGQVMAPVEVGAIDSVSSLDTTFTGGITITLGSNPTGAALSGTTTVRAASGVATFGNLTIDKPGTYTLQASATGATSATSSAFEITTITTP
jgi:hypothetical protein